MIENIKENSIVIVQDNYKTEFIRKFRKSKNLYDVKIIGLNEFKKKFYFDYTKETIFYVHKKYGVIKEIAEIYLENLYYLCEDNSKKMKYLKDLKTDLIERKLLKFDEPFKNFLRGKTIVLYDLKHVDKFYTKMFNEISLYAIIEHVDETKEKTKKPLYKFQNKESEIAFVAEKIIELLKKGIPIDKIKIANINDNYKFALEDTFKSFHIPLELDSSESIASTIVVKTFKESFCESIETSLENIKPLIKSQKDKKIYKYIIDVINDYVWCKDHLEVRDFIFDDLDKKKMPKCHLNHAVRAIDFITDVIYDDEYVFLINFNQGVIPHNYKDENYLNDNLRNKIGISDSVDLNKNALLKIQERIACTKNLIVTYSIRDLGGDLYISNAFKEDLLSECDANKTYSCSDVFNKRILVKEKDENRKYGTITEDLKMLSKHYEDEPYLNYDNTFKGLDKNKLNAHLQNKLTLSYSSMNSYYHCSFKYYLDNILKIDKFEDTFEIVVGNIYHEVLSNAFKKNFDFEISWNHAIEHTEFPFGSKERFFLSILKDELIRVIEEIKRQNEYTKLDKALYEQKISIPLKDGRVEFKGFVDKIMYGEFGEEKIVSIVDYKTGNPELSLDNAIYGLDMQLPIYAYLIQQFDELKDAKIGGFYLQKILNNIKDPDKKHESLKLQGYSNSSTEILNFVDETYNDSKIIKSLRTGSNGFYAYSKVLSTAEIDRLTDIVKEKITNAADRILDAEFMIDPKEIDDKLVGCKFCKYKDICYMNNKNIKKLKKISKKDFLGGDKNAELD